MRKFAGHDVHRAISSAFSAAYMRATTVVRPITTVYITAHSVKVSKDPVEFRASCCLFYLRLSVKQTTALDIPGSMCT